MVALDDQELRKAFFIESGEIIETITIHLDALMKNHQDEDALHAIFRGIHTIKGNSSFLNIDKITKISHAAETLLDKTRNKIIPVNFGLLEIVGRVLDEFRFLINEQDLQRNISPILELIQGFLGGDLRVVASLNQAEALTKINDKIAKVATGNFVRVDENKVGKIIGLVSELELISNFMEKVPERIELLCGNTQDLKFELDHNVSKLVRLTKSLSGIVYGVRLLPVNTIFQRFPRVVNDLAQKLGKEIHLKILNGDAELDKNIIESIADPITHLIRNAVDHGIESREERLKLKKRSMGTITLNSFMQGNYVYIEICDDGRGIDGDKILNKAIEKGIVPAHKASNFTPAQKRALIFAPGFSTAESITDISGRGVGMDVVKSNINKLKGTVIIDSIVGRGTIIQLRFPMSIAVIFSLFAKINGADCAFPMDQVDASYDYRKEDFLELIPNYEKSEDFLALYSLRELVWGKKEEERRDYHVLRFRGKRGKNIGFLVDDFSTIEEAVVQSVDSYVAALPGIQGATMRKDGSVSLVLNPASILEMSQRSKPLAYVKIPVKEELAA